MNITHEHLHHLARKHHATMQKLEGIKGRIANVTGRFVGTLETGAGAWLGGAVEGYTHGASLGPVPVNLAAGIVLLGLGQIDQVGRWGTDLANVGNGLIGSYLAATGYAFGKRWKETGKAFGGGGHPYTQPYGGSTWGSAVPPPGSAVPPPVQGDLTPQQMAAIVQHMQAAATAPAHP